MKARIQLNGTLSEEIEVKNGLRQGCCLAPVLFNLYASLPYSAAERWAARVCELEGVGVNLQFKLDGKLFRRYTRNASQKQLTECQFADDVAYLATRWGLKGQ